MEEKNIKKPVYVFNFSMKVLSENGVRVPAYLVRKEQTMRVNHKVNKVVIDPLQEHELRAFDILTRKLITWKWGPLPVFCSFGLRERKNMLELWHLIAVRVSGVKSRFTGEDVKSDQIGFERSLRDTRMARRNLPEITKKEYSAWWRSK